MPRAEPTPLKELEDDALIAEYSHLTLAAGNTQEWYRCRKVLFARLAERAVLQQANEQYVDIMRSASLAIERLPYTDARLAYNILTNAIDAAGTEPEGA